MKIQEMRSGILHLPRKAEVDLRPEVFEPIIPPQAVAAPAAVEPATITPQICELDEPRWSVVSFDQIEAGGLTYRQAAALQSTLELNDVNGLVIVTDEAAHRVPH